MASSAEMEGWLMRPVSQHRVGRRRSTTRDHISNVAIDVGADVVEAVIDVPR